MAIMAIKEHKATIARRCHVSFQQLIRCSDLPILLIFLLRSRCRSNLGWLKIWLQGLLSEGFTKRKNGSESSGVNDDSTKWHQEKVIWIINNWPKHHLKQLKLKTMELSSRFSKFSMCWQRRLCVSNDDYIGAGLQKETSFSSNPIHQHSRLNRLRFHSGKKINLLCLL